jgi:ABC-type branched-subunit amino acid transport system substrate-binding protein
MITRRIFLQSATAAAFSAQSLRAARAENAPGVTDAEIKIGQTMPYSGPASAYGVIGRTELAYFKMINEQGGINGRKLNLISVDDGYSPPKTVEQVRRLVEQEQVAFLFQTLGTACNLAVRQYLNDNKIPQLFLATGATTFSDPQHFPWTMGYNPSYQTEARIYAKHILATKLGARIAALYQNDDYGRDFLIGLKDGLGPDHAPMVVKEVSYDATDPTVDSQIITLQGSGADVFLIAATPKAATQAIRKAYDIGWTPTRYLNLNASSIATVLKPAGLEKSKGVISAGPYIEVADPRWRDSPDLKEWQAFTSKYMSATEYVSSVAAYGFGAAATMAQVLRQCGSDFSRENIMNQASNLRDFHAPLLWPGITINTSPTNYSPIRQLQLQTFNGEGWDPIGDVMSD